MFSTLPYLSSQRGRFIPRQSKEHGNYIYLRWENLALLLRTSGILQLETDRFYDVKERDLIIPISSLVSLNTNTVERPPLFLTKETINGLKAKIADVASKDHVYKLIVSKRLLKLWDYTNVFPQLWRNY